MAKDKKVTQSKQPAEKVTPVKKRGPRLKPTLFHAVAGLITQRHGLILPRHRKMYKALGRPLPRPLSTAEAYFRKKGDYTRYKRKGDSYFAHRRLPADQSLPSSDLVKALHKHAARMWQSGKGGPTKIYEGEVLLSLGILMEETVKESMRVMGESVVPEPGTNERDYELTAVESKDPPKKRRSKAKASAKKN